MPLAKPGLKLPLAQGQGREGRVGGRGRRKESRCRRDRKRRRRAIFCRKGRGPKLNMSVEICNTGYIPPADFLIKGRGVPSNIRVPISLTLAVSQLLMLLIEG